MTDCAHGVPLTMNCGACQDVAKTYGRPDLPMADLAVLQEWAAAVMTSRPPDFIIGPEDNPYMRRWFIVPRNPYQNIYLHEILRSDDDRAGHDHPWNNQTLVIDGGYTEQTYEQDRPWVPDYQYKRFPGSLVSRQPTDTHRLIVPEGGRAVTLFTTGPRIREWGFWCPGDEQREPRWVVWTDFTSAEDSGLVGKGCGE